MDVGELLPTSIALANESPIVYGAPKNLDWRWFSDNGFLDTTSGDDAWVWLKPIESVSLDSPSVGDFAFDDCQTLVTVNLSSNVRSIGESAFYKCGHLQTISGLDNVRRLGNWAFDRCVNLQLNHRPTNLVDMGYGAFANCQKLVGDITIPSGVTCIGEQTFVNCSGLTDVTIHANVVEVGEDAFAGCSAMARLTFQGRTLEQV